MIESFKLVDGGILCRLCLTTSHDREDVRLRRCPYCNIDHLLLAIHLQHGRRLYWLAISAIPVFVLNVFISFTYIIAGDYFGLLFVAMAVYSHYTAMQDWAQWLIVKQLWITVNRILTQSAKGS